MLLRPVHFVGTRVRNGDGVDVLDGDVHQGRVARELPVAHPELEGQGGARRNRRGPARGSVGDLGRTHEAALAALAHHRHPFGPAADHPVEGEAGGLSAVDAAVEDFPVRKGSVVVHLDHAGSGGVLAGPWAQLGDDEARAGGDGFFLGLF